MHTALRRTFATTAATAVVMGGMLAAAGAASAADTTAISDATALLGGCTTQYEGKLLYNPNPVVPSVSYSLAGIVTVNASGTVLYAKDDANDTVWYVGCVV